MKFSTDKQLDNYVEIVNPVNDFFCRPQSLHLNNELVMAFWQLKEGETDDALHHLEAALWMLGLIEITTPSSPEPSE